MCRLATFVLGAAVAVASAQTSTPVDVADQRPTTPTTGPNTTGTPDMGATVPGQRDREEPAKSRKRVAAPPRGDQETGTPVAGSAVSGPATVKGNNGAGSAGAGPEQPAGTAATTRETTGHIPMTAARPARAATTATTHSGSTPIAADQSDVRRTDGGSADRRTPSMPATSAGWLGMMLAGSVVSGLGMALRRR